MAPVAGAQDGIVLVKHMGLMPPFETLKLQGARQDGSTWTDTVYDAGEIMLSLEASGTTPQDIRDVLRTWVSAWDPEVGNPGYPTSLGKLSVFTPDQGEWWATVRVAKNFSDVFDQDYTFSGRQKITWEVHNSNPFWQSVDSTSVFNASYDSESLAMSTLSDSTTLPAGWTQVYSVTGEGTYGTKNGSGQWQNGGSAASDVVNYAPTTSATNNQVVSIQYAGPNLANLFNFTVPLGHNACWARLNTTPAGSWAGVTGVRLQIGLDTFRLSYFNAGTETIWFELPFLAPPIWGDVFTLVAGTETNEYEFVLQRNGRQFFSYTDTAHQSSAGASYLGWGFGAGTGFQTDLFTPPPLGSWYAGVNSTVTQSGYVPLTNMGDVPAWPRYLCYGPGTFAFGNGPGNTTSVTIGPLEDGQVVLVTTEPRLRSVIDVTPTQVIPQNKWQTLFAEIISFVTNNNTPPLLRELESFFGIVPPQGSLYSTMIGRFTNPVPRSYYGQPLTTYQIPVSITGAGPNSGIVAAITPQRRWPL